MLKFLKDNFSTCITILFSSISLIISLITLWSNLKRLDIVIEDRLGDIENIFFNVIDYKNNLPAITFGKGKVCFIKIVNPSPKDIAFFDLGVANMDTFKPIFFLTNGALELTACNNRSIFFPVGGSDSLTLARLNCPHANYGIFKSNSFTRLDIAFYPVNKTGTVLVSFKVAISTFSNNKKATDRKKFKYYERIFNYSL